MGCFSQSAVDRKRGDRCDRKRGDRCDRKRGDRCAVSKGKSWASLLLPQAKCFLAKDRERLLAVIEAGFGDFREFNKIVRGIFATRTILTESLSTTSVRSTRPRVGGISCTAQECTPRNFAEDSTSMRSRASGRYVQIVEITPIVDEVSAAKERFP